MYKESTTGSEAGTREADEKHLSTSWYLWTDATDWKGHYSTLIGPCMLEHVTQWRPWSWSTGVKSIDENRRDQNDGLMRLSITAIIPSEFHSIWMSSLDSKSMEEEMPECSLRMKVEKMSSTHHQVSRLFAFDHSDSLSAVERMMRSLYCDGRVQDVIDHLPINSSVRSPSDPEIVIADDLRS